MRYIHFWILCWQIVIAVHFRYVHICHNCWGQVVKINKYGVCEKLFLLLYTLGFKFQLLSRMERFYIYSTLKFIHNCTVHWGQQDMRSERFVQVTKASNIWGMRGPYRALRPVLKGYYSVASLLWWICYLTCFSSALHSQIIFVCVIILNVFVL